MQQHIVDHDFSDSDIEALDLYVVNAFVHQNFSLSDAYGLYLNLQSLFSFDVNDHGVLQQIISITFSYLFGIECGDLIDLSNWLCDIISPAVAVSLINLVLKQGLQVFVVFYCFLIELQVQNYEVEFSSFIRSIDDHHMYALLEQATDCMLPKYLTSLISKLPTLKKNKRAFMKIFFHPAPLMTHEEATQSECEFLDFRISEDRELILLKGSIRVSLTDVEFMPKHYRNKRLCLIFDDLLVFDFRRNEVLKELNRWGFSRVSFLSTKMEELPETLVALEKRTVEEETATETIGRFFKKTKSSFFGFFTSQNESPEPEPEPKEVVAEKEVVVTIAKYPVQTVGHLTQIGAHMHYVTNEIDLEEDVTVRLQREIPEILILTKNSVVFGFFKDEETIVLRNVFSLLLIESIAHEGDCISITIQDNQHLIPFDEIFFDLLCQIVDESEAKIVVDDLLGDFEI
ncbi:hypothetical protein PCE1_004151 [Barthelona sp. PCE]